MNISLFLTEYLSPCGKLMLGSINDQLCLGDWVINGRLSATINRMERYVSASRELSGADGFELRGGETPVTKLAKAQLEDYFAGKRKEFDVDLLLLGTDFRKSVWEGLKSIPYGEQVSYREFASMLGSESSVRAIASAIGDNPLSIFLPCHRVIGTDKGLRGYAGGLEAKRYLLNLEQPGENSLFKE